ncbi:MAG: protein-disulfide reductase DsbD domain-containing protein [Bacteroidota bacterium]
MRYLFAILLCTLFGTQALQAQIYDPVKWNTRYVQVSEQEFELIFEAKIQDGWAIYSQYLDGDDGPIPTSFDYNKGSHFELIGKNEESGNRKESYDKVFQMNLIKFKKKAIFSQKVKVSDLSKPISGFLEFMTCDETKCLPPDQVDFEFKLEAKAVDGRSGDSGAAPKTEDVASEQKKEAPAASSTKEKEATAKSPAPEEKVAESSSEEEAAPAEMPTEASSSKQSGIFDPVKWSFEIKKVSDEEYDLVYKAKIADGWHIYSQNIEGDDGPIPTEFYFVENEAVERVGAVAEDGPKRIKEYDEVFAMELTKFKKEAIFTQRIKVSDPNTEIKGDVNFMTCEATRCLPPTLVPFVAKPASLSAIIGDQASDLDAQPSGPNESLSVAGGFSIPRPDLEKPVAQCGNSEPTEESTSIWRIFILGLLGGFVALVTPCVFPMIPLTVSFFTKGSENKRKGILNAVWYGASILLVYLVLSLPFHLMDSVNSDVLNEISTNVWLNLAFFAIFMFFAFSFFGYYELTLPSSWTSKSTSAEGIGGALGTFFMALTLALVSFSCTGPILGTLLAGALSSDGGAMQLTAGMGGFGLALALPFGLFAAFPGWLNSLPKSGGWLNTVKVVLGFVEVALAFKFLSNADLVKHWGILKIEPFLIIWILTAIGLGLYLFGKIKFPHDSPLKKITATRWVLGASAFLFAAYLLSGFRYNEETKTFTSLTLLSGLAPPVGYSFIYPNDCPVNLDCFKNLDDGLAYAKKTGKPIMIDFTGYACVNCRKMEEHVWPKKSVYDKLKNDYILISLYVDDRKELPEEEQVVVDKKTGGKRKLRTYGNKWAHFQAEYFDNNSQPYYVLLSADGQQLLNNPVGFTPDDAEYANFLECGLKAFTGGEQEQIGQK